MVKGLSQPVGLLPRLMLSGADSPPREKERKEGRKIERKKKEQKKERKRKKEGRR